MTGGRGRHALTAVAVVMTLLAALSTTAAGQPAPPEPAEAPLGLDARQRQLHDALQADVGPGLAVSMAARGDRARFVGTPADATIARAPGVTAHDPPALAATAFLARNGPLFGLDDARAQLAVTDTAAMPARYEATGSAVRLQQHHDGVPVLGAQVTVQLAADNAVLSTLADVVEDVDVDTSPAVTAADAADTALAATAKHRGAGLHELQASRPRLVIHNPTVLGGPAGPHQAIDADLLAWQVEVTDRGVSEPVRELVLVDAKRAGTVLFSVDHLTTAKDRTVCDNENNPGEAYTCPTTVNPVVRAEGDPATGNTDVDLAYDYAGDTYDFFSNRFGRDSLDDDGLQLVSTVRHCPNSSNCPYANAFWDGAQMVYGEGFAAADDVVGHELTHGVTEFSNDLFYYYQSGAINEAMSDVFGEFVDLTNGSGTDTSGVRWLIGEDIPGIGAIRDMQDPTTFDDPDRMGSPNYFAGSGAGFASSGGNEDNGGVHSNSGVLNKAAYLMTDGDTFNGATVTGLGLGKTARIVYAAATTMLTQGSDYADLADALVQACTNLVGTGGITTGNCNEVADAVAATEMDQQPSSGATMQAPDPSCPAGQFPVTLFSDNMEAGGNWTDDDPGFATFATGYAHSGVRSLYRPNYATTTDHRTSMTTSVSVPAASTTFLRFAHAFEFEEGQFDGGVVEYSVDGGTSWSDAGSLFTHGGYNGVISSSFDNPLGGRQAFTDVSFGYGTSRLDLTSLAGEDVRLRFRVGTDLDVGDLGWLIDDVEVHHCEDVDFGAQLQFVEAEPCAVFDTRHASGSLAGPRDGGEVFTVTVASDDPIPPGQGGEACAAAPAHAVAVELNLVAPLPAARGNLLVSRSGVAAQGGVVNFSPGITNSSSVPVEVDGQGRIDVEVNANVDDATDVRGVVLGYYVDPAGTGGGDGRLFVPSSACAVFDTRGFGGKFDGGETRTFDVAGNFDPTTQGGQACTPPPAGVSGVLVNLVAVQPDANGNLRAVAAGGTAQGGVVNFAGGRGNNSNAVPLGVPGSGEIDVTANTTGTDSVHVRGVVLGYFVDDGHPAAVDGLELVPMTACALFDTRHGTEEFGERLDPDQTVTATIASDVALPSAQAPSGCVPPPDVAEAVMLNLVAIGPDDNGNLQLAAAGTIPDGGVVNFTGSRGTNSNAVVTGVADGDASVTARATVADVVDVRGVALGWYASPA